MPTPPVPPRIHRPTDRAGARAAGVTDWQLRHLEVVRSSRDTYLPAAMADDVRARVAAVLLGAPPSAVISHLTAAALWGLQVPLVAEDRRVHLTVPSSTRIRSRSDRRVHCADLEDWQIARRDGVALTSPGRTWRDLAGGLPAAALLAVTDQMLARRYPPEAFRRLVDGGRGVRGIRTARQVLAVADPLAGSPMESVLRWMIHEAGLPAPVLQHAVRGPHREFIGYVDLAWPDRGCWSSSTATSTARGTCSSTTSAGRTAWSSPAGWCCASPPPTCGTAGVGPGDDPPGAGRR